MTHFKNLRPLTILAAILIGLMNGCFSENSKLENLAKNELSVGTKIKSVTTIKDIRLNLPGIIQRMLIIKIVAKEPTMFVGGRYVVEICFGIGSDIELEYYQVISVGKCDDMLKDFIEMQKEMQNIGK